MLSLPATTTGAAPLVIYLPGLGESSEAGALWRTAWSAAGYAVLSVQMLAPDESAWTSTLARSGEFRKLGLDRFGAAAARQRLRLLADVVAEGRRRSSQSESVWKRVDWNRLAIAGYDLGAYTATLAAGEAIDNTEDSLPVQVRAAIALSPFANPAKGSIARRYRDVRIPVLFVTSNIDDDPLGLTEGAGQRRVPFDNVPGPRKYLLTLRGVSHARLAGGAGALTPDPTARPTRDDGSVDLGPRRPAAGQRPGQAERDDPIIGPPRPVERAVVRGLSANALRTRMLAAQAVSTAFLDAHVNDDARARDWLGEEAPRWLGAVATIAKK